MHDVRAGRAVEDARSVLALKGAKGFEELDDISFVGRVAARGTPEGIVERSGLGVNHDKGGVRMIDRHSVVFLCLNVEGGPKV